MRNYQFMEDDVILTKFIDIFIQIIIIISIIFIVILAFTHCIQIASSN